MNCPVCNHPDATLITEEVDIGVGVQFHTVGADCPACGEIAICNSCGTWTNNHEPWCNL